MCRGERPGHLVLALCIAREWPGQKGYLEVIAEGDMLLEQTAASPNGANPGAVRDSCIVLVSVRDQGAFSQGG